MSRRALEVYEKALVKEHPDLHPYDEALSLHQRASSSYMKSLGSDQPTIPT